MQQGNAKKTSWLKVLLAWTLVPAFGVPITKFVESHYDVSIFGPAITWLLSGIVSVGQWIGRDVTLPFWMVLILLVLVALLLVPFLALVYARFFEKDTQLETFGSPLSADEKVAFIVVGKAIQEGDQFGVDEVREHSQLSRIATQNALDNLFHKQLIRLARDRMHYNYIDLTPLGREYFLELEASTAI